MTPPEEPRLSAATPGDSIPESPSAQRTPSPKSSRKPSPKPAGRRREPLYFVVIVLLCADVLFGLGLAVFAEEVISFHPMAVMGIGLAALGLGILAYFVLFGGGSDRKR